MVCSLPFKPCTVCGFEIDVQPINAVVSCKTCGAEYDVVRRADGQTCLHYVQIFYADRRPASFASVTVYEVRRFWFWEYDAWVASRTADFYGRVSLNLTKNRKYHYVCRVPGKRANFWTTLTVCPQHTYAYFP